MRYIYYFRLLCNQIEIRHSVFVAEGAKVIGIQLITSDIVLGMEQINDAKKLVWTLGLLQKAAVYKCIMERAL